MAAVYPTKRDLVSLSQVHAAVQDELSWRQRPEQRLLRQSHRNGYALLVSLVSLPLRLRPEGAVGAEVPEH